jgi:FlaA1/EpsC-like NDP-sugar epimerase
LLILDSEFLTRFSGGWNVERRLEGKVAMITGAGAGIGEAIAQGAVPKAIARICTEGR